MMFFKKKAAAAKPSASQLSKSESEPIAEWELDVVVAQLCQIAPDIECKEIEPALVHARLADHCRDVGAYPMPSDEFVVATRELTVESWRRLALAVGVLDEPACTAAFATMSKRTPIRQLVRDGFVRPAQELDVVTVSMICQSEVRMEEFARLLASALAIVWKGESAAQSKKRLNQINYRRLLAEADAAKMSAKERMEYLRKKQEEDDGNRRPRGKQ